MAKFVILFVYSSLGYIYEEQEYLLGRYVKFAESRTPSPVPLKGITDAFLSALTDAAGTLYQMVSVLREFSRYLQARGFRESYMVPPKTVSQPTAEEPYFFTEKEIEAFFEKLDAVRAHSSFKGREVVLPALFWLLYCCGMRCKELLAEKEIDYAFFCCDGVYNMGLEEAAECAEMVSAKHNIPYHMTTTTTGRPFDRELAEQFVVENRLIIEDGEEILIE